MSEAKAEGDVAEVEIPQVQPAAAPVDYGVKRVQIIQPMTPIFWKDGAGYNRWRYRYDIFDADKGDILILRGQAVDATGHELYDSPRPSAEHGLK